MTHGRIGRRENVALFTAALLAAIGGLIYELILGTAASYLLGDTVRFLAEQRGMGEESLCRRLQATTAAVYGTW